MQTIIYTSPNEIEGEIDAIENFFEHGADFLYIRKPELDDFSLVDFVEKIPEKYWSKCISTSLIITKEFNLGGYHFTKDIWKKNALYNEKVLDWLNQEGKVSSISAHHIDEIILMKDKFSHIIVSPIFPSISKPNHATQWDFEKLKTTISHQKKAKLFAVGGVEDNKIEQIKKLGFDGIGILGFVWNSHSPIETFKSIYASSHSN